MLCYVIRMLGNNMFPLNFVCLLTTFHSHFWTNHPDFFFFICEFILAVISTL